MVTRERFTTLSNSTSTSTLFWIFLKLGCTSFGGPIAHLGYFRAEFVTKRRSISETEYADLVGLCQFLPGPASSQVGMAIGHRFAGVQGAVAAWLGFTLPSSLLMFAAASMLAMRPEWADGAVVHGLKIAAVVIVAQAVIGMWNALCPDVERRIWAIGSAALLLIAPSLWLPIGIISLAGIVGWVRAPRLDRVPLLAPRKRYWITFCVLLILPALPTAWMGFAVFNAFYRAGALVFGGGHVVLPLLQTQTVGQGWLGTGDFLGGYGAAQALPGPLFTFATFVGARIGGLPMAVLATVGIFLGGFLLLMAFLPVWTSLKKHPSIRTALNLINATVVGILAAAWVSPVASSALVDLRSWIIAGCGFGLLQIAKAPPLAVVVFCGVSAWCLYG